MHLPSMVSGHLSLTFFFSWSIVALQCCWFLIYCKMYSHFGLMYTHIPSVLDFLPIQVTTEDKVEFPVLYSRFLLVLYFIHSIHSAYMSVPISQFIASPYSHFNCRKDRCFLESTSLSTLMPRSFRILHPSMLGLPSWFRGKEHACNAGDAAGAVGLIPGSGKSLGEGNGNPLQYSCLENPMGSRELDTTHIC